MIETVEKEQRAKIILFLFIILTIFWIILQLGFFNDLELFNHTFFKFFGAIYGVIALLGGLWSFAIAKKWGLNSMIGKAILMFSLGLFAQEFGQITLSYIDYVMHIQGAYPSLGDLGYFGSIPLYICGTLLLARASGVAISLKNFKAQIQALLIPLALLIVSYLLFLKNYEFDWSNLIKIFLDFGYPFGQAIYISLALLTYFLSRSTLGGMMKNKVLFILFALCFQYAADFTFLYQSSKGTWQVGGINDYMYLVAYFVMTLGLLQFNTALVQLREVKK